MRNEKIKEILTQSGKEKEFEEAISRISDNTVKGSEIGDIIGEEKSPATAFLKLKKEIFIRKTFSGKEKMTKKEEVLIDKAFEAAQIACEQVEKYSPQKGNYIEDSLVEYLAVYLFADTLKFFEEKEKKMLTMQDLKIYLRGFGDFASIHKGSYLISDEAVRRAGEKIIDLSSKSNK